MLSELWGQERVREGLARLPAHCPGLCPRWSTPQHLLSDHLLWSPPSRGLSPPSAEGARSSRAAPDACPGIPRHQCSTALNTKCPFDRKGEGIWKSHPIPSLRQPRPGFVFLLGRGQRVRGLVRGAGGKQSHARVERNQGTTCSRPGRAWSPGSSAPKHRHLAQH